MTKFQLEVLALANIFLDRMDPASHGKGKFCIVQKPDYEGGHYIQVERSSYEFKDFEYPLWEGTPWQYAQELPSFENHYEPLHEEPSDEELNALQALKRSMRYWGLRDY